MRVFVDLGYDGATAEHIAKASDVSVRTFFRYFPHGKEDVMVLTARRAMDVFEVALHERPADESVVTAVRAAIDSLYEGPSNVAASDAARLVGEIARSDGALVARMMGERQIRADGLVPELARRMGVDPAADIRPRLLAHSVHIAMSVSWLSWLEGYRSDTKQIVDEVLELMRPAFEAALPEAPGKRVRSRG